MSCLIPEAISFVVCARTITSNTPTHTHFVFRGMLAIDPQAATPNRKAIYKKLAKHTVTLFSFFLAVRAAYPDPPPLPLDCTRLSWPLLPHPGRSPLTPHTPYVLHRAGYQ